MNEQKPDADKGAWAKPEIEPVVKPRRFDTVEVYRGGMMRRKWYWRYIHSNGNIMADQGSGSGYFNSEDAIQGAMTVTGTVSDGEGWLKGYVIPADGSWQIRRLKLVISDKPKGTKP